MMALNWDELQISIVDPDKFLVTEDELVYSLKAEQRMIIFGGERGLDGAPGADGKTPTPAGTWNSYKTYSRLDIVTNGASSYIAVTDVPIGIALSNQAYWQLLVAGNGAPTVWGDIIGTMSNQTDLQNALDGKENAGTSYTKAEEDAMLADKANSADLGTLAGKDNVDYITEVVNKPSLGTMSSKNDAPTDGKKYGRKDGNWIEIQEGGGGGGGGDAIWGDITGTLSNQTDLQNALDEKANTTYLGGMASEDDAPSDGKTYGRKNGAWSEVVSGNDAVWGNITGTLANQTDLMTALDSKANGADTYTKAEVNSALADKADADDLGTMASENDAPSDGKTYGRNNGAWAEVTGGGSGSAVWGDITGTLSAQTDLQTALNGKANTGTSYTKTEADALLADKADADSVYTKSEVNSALALKANVGASYTKSEDDALLALKANSADVYTKTAIDNALADKADVGDSYTKAEDDALLADKVSTTAMQTALAGKQNTLTFDTTPTTGSTNPVTSGGIKVALAGYVALEVIADIYDPEATYQTDDVFMKDGKLVRYVEGIEGLSPLPLSDYFETHLLYQGEYLAYDGSLYQATQSFEVGPQQYSEDILFQLAQPYLSYVNVDPYVPGQYFPIGHIVSYNGGYYTVIQGTDPQFIEISVEWLLSNRYYTKAEIDAMLAQQ